MIVAFGLPPSSPIMSRLNWSFALLALILMPGCYIRHPERYLAKARAHGAYDAVIVPGMPYDNGLPEPVHARLVWSVYLYRTGLAKKIVMSGAAVYTPWVEAEVLREYAVALGVPREDILIDDQAQHSTENVYYGFKVARKAGLEHVALASDEFQTRLLKSFCRRVSRKLKGQPIGLIPLVRDSIQTEYLKPLPPIDASVAHVDSFVSIMDRESGWKRMRGTLGKHINWREP